MKRTNEFIINGNYITAEWIEMNENCDKFACAYMDDGVWHLLVCDLDKVIIDLNVNDLFNI